MFSFMGFAVGKQLQKTSAEEALATHQLALAGQHAFLKRRAIVLSASREVSPLAAIGGII